MNLELSDERVDAMRSHVMGTVTEDVRQRGRRARKTLVGGIGALAVLTVLGVSLPVLTGENLSTTSHQGDGGTSAAMPEPGMAGDGLTGASHGGDSASSLDARAADEYASKQAAPEGDIAPIPPDQPALTAPGKNREVITSGNVQLRVRDAAKEATAFTRWVEKNGGRVDARNELRDEEVSSSSVTARIPSKQVNAAIAQLRRQGEVTSANLQRDDVTAQGADLDGRIKALKISIERLENILSQAGSSSEVIEAETALSQRQQELESLQLQRRSLDDQVALSTLVADFVQFDAPGTVAPGGFRGGLVAGWNALIDTVNAAVTATGAAIPWLGVLAVAGGLWWGVRRVRRQDG